MFVNCLSCQNYDHCDQLERWDVGCINHKPRPQTNADRIRAMTDEELAVWIAETSNCSDWCILNEQCKTKPDYACCINVWLDWLRQEAEE